MRDICAFDVGPLSLNFKQPMAADFSIGSQNYPVAFAEGLQRNIVTTSHGLILVKGSENVITINSIINPFSGSLIMDVRYLSSPSDDMEKLGLSFSQSQNQLSIEYTGGNLKATFEMGGVNCNTLIDIQSNNIQNNYFKILVSWK